MTNRRCDFCYVGPLVGHIKSMVDSRRPAMLKTVDGYVACNRHSYRLWTLEAIRRGMGVSEYREVVA